MRTKHARRRSLTSRLAPSREPRPDCALHLRDLANREGRPMPLNEFPQRAEAAPAEAGAAPAGDETPPAAPGPAHPLLVRLLHWPHSARGRRSHRISSQEPSSSSLLHSHRLSPIAAAMRRWRRGSGLDRCGKLLLPPPPPPVVAATVTAAAAAAAVEAGAAATAASLPQPGLDRCCKPAAVAVVVAAAVVVADTLFPKRGYPPMNCNEISKSERHAQFA